MTLSELIKILSNYQLSHTGPDLRVVIDDPDTGWRLDINPDQIQVEDRLLVFDPEYPSLADEAEAKRRSE